MEYKFGDQKYFGDLTMQVITETCFNWIHHTMRYSLRKKWKVGKHAAIKQTVIAYTNLPPVFLLLNWIYSNWFCATEMYIWFP